MKNYIILLLTFAGLLAAVAQAKPKPEDLLLNTDPEPDLAQAGFVDLFDGNTLDGWTVRGGAMEFEVKEGSIVGTCVKGQPNGFLCTDKNYGDFIFTADFKWEVLGNSGIMFRAGARTEKGKERVFGYQSEMDNKERAYTGGIYGEAMGGWKYPLSKPVGHTAARAAIKNHKEWNRVTIHAQGNVLKTWVNGVPCSHLINDERAEGFFGLQVHSGPQGTIHWKNIRIMELDKDEDSVDLFAADDFNSWQHANGKSVGDGWTLTDGVVFRHAKKAGDIVTKQEYKNFDLTFEFKISEGGNSGVKYRSHNHYGPEYQVLDDERHSNGKDPNKTVASLYDLKAAVVDKVAKPAMEWNSGRIVAKGSILQHWLNGQLVMEVDQESEDWKKRLGASKYKKTPDFGSKAGRILLQDHSDKVWYRNVMIRNLDN